MMYSSANGQCERLMFAKHTWLWNLQAADASPCMLRQQKEKSIRSETNSAFVTVP